MRILVVGGGGREHALVWKIAQSPLVSHIYCAPGNPGIAAKAECVPLKATDIDGLLAFAEANHVDLTVVGPEAPLSAGIVDRFESKGLRIFGPSSSPARLEGSKIFAKKLMKTFGIPTADFWICDTLSVAQARINDFYSQHPADAKIVIKADGLAAGKGVVVAGGKEEALAALQSMMGDRVFGAAGDHVVIEECLFGEEASIMVITDGKDIVPLLPSQDHKRIGEGDTGANTGGMGAYTPVPAAPPAVVEEALERIVRPAIRAIAELGIPYMGVLYAGIMITSEGIKTIEFNCRLGDPETQVILPMLESDLVPLLLGATEGNLATVPVKWRQGASTCVVAASGGYPGTFETGKPISGLEEANAQPNCAVFHAGTTLKDGKVVTSGGRVLSVTGFGDTVMDSVANAYLGLGCIKFENIYYRHDIAHRALRK